MMKKGIIYSQPALGIGHLMRSLYICKSLVQDFTIDFFLGAPGVPFPIDSPNFHLYTMPPLWIHSWQDPPKLVDPTGQHTVQEQFERRRHYLESFVNQSYAFAIIEFYPFSKGIFGLEIERLIKKVKDKNPNCKMICSLRDIIDKKSTQEEERIVKKINENFDAILVHADPSVVKLEETFAHVADIADKIVYTGYVSNPEKAIESIKRENLIVVSIGSGSYGYELARAASLAAIFIQDYHFVFVLGPKSPPEVAQDISLAVKEMQLSNVTIVDFLPDFYDVLRKSTLSISLGGSTIVDAIATKTPSLIYVDAHVEHVLRAEKFAQKGVIQTMHLEDLHPDRLCPLILSAAATKFPSANIDVDGSQHTLQAILKIHLWKPDKTQRRRTRRRHRRDKFKVNIR